MRRLVRWVGTGILTLGLAALALAAVATFWTKLPGEEMTPAGIRQSTSEYVKMRDGVEIAVTVDLPPDLKVGERVPVLMRTTRYWRGPRLGGHCECWWPCIKPSPTSWKISRRHTSINATLRCWRWMRVAAERPVEIA